MSRLKHHCLLQNQMKSSGSFAYQNRCLFRSTNEADVHKLSARPEEDITETVKDWTDSDFDQAESKGDNLNGMVDLGALWVNSFLASGDICRLLIIFANRLLNH